MSTGQLYPPQAFTREMLSQAFVWLQAQPDSIRGMVSNPESLIALYVKSQRSQLFNQKKMENSSSNPHADAPVSAQNFMTDLKSLAEGLKQFDAPHAQAMAPAPVNPAGESIPKKTSGQSFASQLRNEIPTPKPAAPVTLNPVLQLNSNSQCMIREVKEKLNLSSELEAVNMLVAIAYKNLKSLVD